MKKIRSLTAAGVLTGATVLGGVGLAGATSDGEADAEGTEVPVQLTDEPTTGETDAAPEAPTLPDEAADAARTALAERFAGAGGQDGEEQADGTAEDVSTEDGTAAEADAVQSDHGERVSAVAQETEPGPGHGEAVSEVARQQGEDQRAARAGDDDTAEDGQARADTARHG